MPYIGVALLLTDKSSDKKANGKGTAQTFTPDNDGELPRDPSERDMDTRGSTTRLGAYSTGP